jgi:hypothetical protein
LLGNGPHEGLHFPGHGDDNLMSIFAFGHQLALAFTEPDLRFPTAGLEGWGELFPAQLEVTPDCGRNR